MSSSSENFRIVWREVLRIASTDVNESNNDNNNNKKEENKNFGGGFFLRISTNTHTKQFIFTQLFHHHTSSPCKRKYSQLQCRLVGMEKVTAIVAQAYYNNKLLFWK